jgi:Protein of unknown function (DUF3800)
MCHNGAMLVFIDESGDTGMKLTSPSSSALFIVCLMLFDERDAAALADKRISELKTKLGVRPEFEFHFTKLKDSWRESFLREAAKMEFFYFGVVIDKEAMGERGFHSPSELYRYACHLVLECAKPYFDDATVVIDGGGSRPFKRELTTLIRKKINADGEKKIRKIKIQESQQNNLLQLADMVCGAVARSYTDKPDAQHYRKLVSHLEMEVRRWPK